VLRDPLAVEVVEAIDYPFQARFGAREGLAQWQALRSRCFDGAVLRFLAVHPAGTVVGLGEGLETQFWRVDNGRVRWLAVDLPEAIDLRRRLLPAPPRLGAVAASALDEDWMDEVDPSHGVLVTAQGLLMYLRPEEAVGLVGACARRFPGGAMAFDAVPRWFSARTLHGGMTTAEGYRPPPMPWGMDVHEAPALRAAHPGIRQLRELPLPRGRGPFFAYVAPVLTVVPVVRHKRPSIWLARFGPSA
jgi:O-methyltransferase involved in polyketide biosynthesis